MEALMIPMTTVKNPGLSARPWGARSGEESSFAGHLDRKLADRHHHERNIFGVHQQRGPLSAQKESQAVGRAKSWNTEQAEARSAEQTLIALVGEYLEIIRGQTQDPASGPGTWTVAIDDPAQLVDLAARAGMGETEIAALLEKHAANQGVFSMTDFLSFFSRHLLSLEQDQPVLVPETDLPYLQLILSKLGVTAEELSRIGELAVRGDHTLDLVALLRSLAELDVAGKISLSGWDAEQLQTVLNTAGVSRGLQRELLPELHAPWNQPQRPNLPLELDIARFREILTRGVAEIQNSRPQVEIPAFLAKLKEIFAKTGFAEQRAGWSPAVQAAVDRIYRKLMESIDLAAVKVRPGVDHGATELLEEKFADAGKGALSNRDGVNRGGRAGVGVELASSGAGKADENFSGRHFLDEMRINSQTQGGERGSESFGVADRIADNLRVEALRELNQTSRANPQFEQQIFNRLNSGIMAGLQRNEYRLVMHLYPRELGAVKVDLQIRGNKVALSFALESTRVREILERNMDVLRENLERRGFVLGEFTISLGSDRDQPGESRQRFSLAWTNKQSDMVRRESLTAVAANDRHHRPAMADHSSGVDLFA